MMSCGMKIRLNVHRATGRGHSVTRLCLMFSKNVQIVPDNYQNRTQKFLKR